MNRKLKKGFTLVELLVVMILMGLITTALVMVMQPTTRLYNSVNAKSDEEEGCITLTDYINGELRYATGITIYCNDGSTPPASAYGNYKHFIMLSNETRAASKKGANGYTRHGLVSNFGAGVPCVSDGILHENEFKFSIAGISTQAGAESITLGIDACPMKSNFSSFYPDWDTPYNFTETFQLVNMQNQIGRVSNGVTGTYDSSQSTIWLFYEKPAEATVTNNGNPNGGNPLPGLDPSSSSSSTPSPSSSESVPEIIISQPDPVPSVPEPSSSESSSVPANPTEPEEEKVYVSGSLLVHSRVDVPGYVGRPLIAKGLDVDSYEQWQIKSTDVKFETTGVVSKDQIDYVIEFENINLLLLTHDFSYLQGTNGNSLEMKGNNATGNPAAFMTPDMLLSTGEVWFFNGYYYLTKPDNFDPPQLVSAEFTLHRSSVQPQYSKWGDKLSTIDYKTDVTSYKHMQASSTVTLEKGQFLTILLRSDWYTKNDTYKYEYGFLVENNITDIWVYDGNVYVEQPAEWQD